VVLGTYAKSHLFSTENLHFRAGPTISTLSTQHGVIGPMVCLDIGIPEVARLLCLKGAELLIAPSAWISLDKDLWALLLRSRALDNLAFVVGVNLAGVEGDLEYIGQSMVVGPRGNIIGSLDADEGILITTIDLDEVVTARRRAPRFTQRRPELYGPITEAY
jgi:predicted amidohydrolase